MHSCDTSDNCGLAFKINGGAASGTNMIAFNGQVYFTANDGVQTWEWYRSL